jgi:ectoine hydroxylase-related dioxygenase (phytanoyl-CoA dioxygenase family)
MTPHGGSARITDEHVAEWREHGYAIVRGLLSPDELAAARRDLARYFPTGDEFADARRRYPHLGTTNEAEQPEFPFDGDALNDVTVHPEIVSFVERALGTSAVTLAASLLWAKYTGTRDYEQALHADYAYGYDLLYPREDGDYPFVLVFVYYEDVTAELGPTHVVSRRETRGLDLVPNLRTREEAPELYARERAVTVPAGSALLLSHSTFHRGSALRAPRGARFAHFIGYRATRHAWLGWMAPTQRQYVARAEMQRFVERATPRQRELVGIPPPGHEYWTPEMIAGVGARYPGMDMTPYARAVRAGSRR